MTPTTPTITTSRIVNRLWHNHHFIVEDSGSTYHGADTRRRRIQGDDESKVANESNQVTNWTFTTSCFWQWAQCPCYRGEPAILKAIQDRAVVRTVVDFSIIKTSQLSAASAKASSVRLQRRERKPPVTDSLAGNLREH